MLQVRENEISLRKFSGGTAHLVPKVWVAPRRSATTYPCEQGFSALTLIKTKARKRLDPGRDMRIALGKIEPCIEDVMTDKFQLHKSH